MPKKDLTGNPDKLRSQPKAVEFVKHFFDAGKPVAAICHAPWMLVEAGVVDGRTLTFREGEHRARYGEREVA